MVGNGGESLASQHATALLELLAAESGDVLVNASMALDMARFAAELRVRAELRLGELLAAHPDPGGRSRASGPHLARQLREMVGLQRGDIGWLVRLASLDESVVESVVDELWSVDAFPRALNARAVVLRVEPTPSVDGQ
jgi:hypothetical protein